MFVMMSWMMEDDYYDYSNDILYAIAEVKFEKEHTTAVMIDDWMVTINNVL